MARKLLGNMEAGPFQTEPQQLLQNINDNQTKPLNDCGGARQKQGHSATGSETRQKEGYSATTNITSPFFSSPKCLLFLF